MSKHKYIAGYKQGMLTVVEKLPSIVRYGHNVAVYKCKCDCGNDVVLDGINIRHAKSCGCLWHNTKPIPPGTMFGRLKVLEQTNVKKHGCWVYKCECQCNKRKIIFARSDMLRNGETTSCGCVHDKLFRENSILAYEKMFIYDTSIPKLKENSLQSNNTSGYPGVSWHRGRSMWVARIMFQKKSYSLGYYDDIKLAAEAYKIAKEKIHGDFLKWYEKNKNNDIKGDELKKI